MTCAHCLLNLAVSFFGLMLASRRINNKPKLNNSGSNGGRETKIDSFHDGEAGEHNGVRLEEVPKIFAIQNNFFHLKVTI